MQDKIDLYTSIIEDAERRIGSYISIGGRDTDDYVKKQIKIILEPTFG